MTFRDVPRVVGLLRQREPGEKVATFSSPGTVLPKINLVSFGPVPESDSRFFCESTIPILQMSVLHSYLLVSRVHAQGEGAFCRRET